MVSWAARIALLIAIFCLVVGDFPTVAQATTYTCLTTAVRAPGMEKYYQSNGYADLPEKEQQPVIIDTDDLTMTVAGHPHRLSELKPSGNAFGSGIQAAVPDLDARLIMRMRDGADFFAFVVGGGEKEVVGLCPHSMTK